MSAVQGKFPGGIPGQGRTRKMAGAAGYGSANKPKHGKMEDAFINFALETVEWDAAFTNLTSMNGNLINQMRHQEDHIRDLQA